MIRSMQSRTLRWLASGIGCAALALAAGCASDEERALEQGKGETTSAPKSGEVEGEIESSGEYDYEYEYDLEEGEVDLEEEASFERESSVEGEADVQGDPGAGGEVEVDGDGEAEEQESDVGKIPSEIEHQDVLLGDDDEVPGTPSEIEHLGDEGEGEVDAEVDADAKGEIEAEADASGEVDAGLKADEGAARKAGEAEAEQDRAAKAGADRTGQRATERQGEPRPPAMGYLKAHKNQQEALQLLGGPIRARITQEQGMAHLGLPGKRKLDPHVFGTPDQPRSLAGTPLATGLPLEMRESSRGQFGTTKEATPYGNQVAELRESKLTLELTDATATDAATSRDQVQLEATWKDAQGNTYKVTCDEVIPAGIESPVFGGVVTNHLAHGFTGIESPLLPTQFVYAGFWGKGQVEKNGQVIERDRLIHGMLAEKVHLAGGELVLDEGVLPTELQFHLEVPALKVEGERFQKAPLNTGYTTPDGQPLESIHVIFDDVTIEAERVQQGR